MTFVEDREKVLADLESGEAVPLDWDSAYDLFRHLQIEIGETPPASDTPEEYRASLEHILRLATLLQNVGAPLLASARADVARQTRETTAHV